jgi:signal transduction histidine kinase
MPQTTTPAGPGRLRRVGWQIGLVGINPVALVLAASSIAFLALSWTWIMLPVLVLLVAGTRVLADGYRTVVTALSGVEVPSPYRPRPPGGWSTRLLGLARDPATWRDLAWLWAGGTGGFAMVVTALALFLGAGWQFLFPVVWAIWPDTFTEYWWFDITSFPVAAAVTWPVGALYLWLWWRIEPPLMRGYARFARSLLAPTASAGLAERVEHLTVSRAETVDTQAAELRRIERDLHDGAQARLVALGMSLGMADDIVDRDPQAAKALLAEARSTTSQALAELRDLVRGIHPPVLADRGLEGAAQALALASPLPVAVEIDIPGRLPAPVESAGYFVTAELLTNVIKHSGASRAWIRLTHARGSLSMVVADDGHGGADPSGGTGLRGVERRLAAFDGTVVVSSPPGGPTVVTMELPCELSSVRTSPSSGTA